MLRDPEQEPWNDTGAAPGGQRSQSAMELRELSRVLHDRIHRVAPTVEIAGPRPLHIHARYSRNEALAAFGMEKPRRHVRRRSRWVPGDQADVFLVSGQVCWTWVRVPETV